MDQPIPADFWAQVEQCLITMDFAGAINLLRQGLNANPKDNRILDTLGTALMQTGDFTAAEEVLQVSVQLDPNNGHEKYMSLAGMSSGQQALALYKKGLEILVPQKQNLQDPTQLKECTSQIVGALCAVAEIFMTDECFDPNAETTCESVLGQALSHDANSAEALQVLASFKISQQKNDEALHFLQRSHAAWKDVDPNDPYYPSFDFRVTAAKLYLELEQHQASVDILDDLLEEDEDIAELWFLQGFALIFIDATQSLECLLKSRDLLQRAGCQEPIILNRVAESIANVQKIIEEESQQMEMG